MVKSIDLRAYCILHHMQCALSSNASKKDLKNNYITAIYITKRDIKESTQANSNNRLPKTAVVNTHIVHGIKL